MPCNGFLRRPLSVYAEAIKRLLAAQIALRNNRRLETARRASRLPVVRDVAKSHLGNWRRPLRYATDDVGKSSLRQTEELLVCS